MSREKNEIEVSLIFLQGLWNPLKDSQRVPGPYFWEPLTYGAIS